VIPIRPAVPADAAALLELKQRLDRETSFMMYEAGEREASVQDLAADLDRVAQSATPSSSWRTPVIT
jgi:hypothetical protein